MRPDPVPHNDAGFVLYLIPAAGTADFKANVGLKIGHLLHDLDPFIMAENLGEMAIEDYYDVRLRIIGNYWGGR